MENYPHTNLMVNRVLMAYEWLMKKYGFLMVNGLLMEY
jgi:hypothetical protein